MKPFEYYMLPFSYASHQLDNFFLYWRLLWRTVLDAGPQRKINVRERMVREMKAEMDHLKGLLK